MDIATAELKEAMAALAAPGAEKVRERAEDLYARYIQKVRRSFVFLLGMDPNPNHPTPDWTEK